MINLSNKGVISMTVGQNIKRIRTEKNLTQTQLSTRMGYSSNSVLSKLENDHMAPTITHLRRLSIALKVSQALIMDVDGVYEEEEETKTPVVTNDVTKNETVKPVETKQQSVVKPVEQKKDVVNKPVDETIEHNR